MTFAGGREPLDRDLVIVVQGAEETELTAVVAHREGDTGTFALSHVPDLAGAAFVVVETRCGDRSAREAAEARPIPVHAPRGWALFEVEPAVSALLGAPLRPPSPSAWPSSPPMSPMMIAAPAEPAAFMGGALSSEAKLDAGAARPEDVYAGEEVRFAPRASLLARQLASGQRGACS